jgi:hypothetical protein
VNLRSPVHHLVSLTIKQSDKRQEMILIPAMLLIEIINSRDSYQDVPG